MTLTYFYDGRCGLCSTLRRLFEREETRLRVDLLDLHSDRARSLLAGCPLDPEREVLATDGEGHWWQGADAWIMALWATERWAMLSLRLAEPALRPHAGRLCAAISARRHDLSRLLGMAPDRVQVHHLEELPAGASACVLPPPLMHSSSGPDRRAEVLPVSTVPN